MMLKYNNIKWSFTLVISYLDIQSYDICFRFQIIKFLAGRHLHLLRLLTSNSNIS